jgi:citron Rho-interacting kinase
MQDRRWLYLVTEYLPGGDLRALINRNAGSLSEELTMFYMAELTLALNSLHKLGFCHLDMRPENIGLDRLGHVKLIDFGAAEQMDDDGHIFPSSNLYGCPLYLAPELPLALGKQSGNSHRKKLVKGRKCDFWSLGICGFEMRTGNVPRGNKAAVMKELLEQGEECVVTMQLRSVLEGLLQHDTDKRFGYDDLVRHGYFLTIDWDELRNTCAPLVPELPDGEEDISNFEPNRSPETKVGTELSSPRRKVKKKEGEEYIVGFSYIGKHSDNARFRDGIHQYFYNFSIFFLSFF